jgi:hypothetical protein
LFGTLFELSTRPDLFVTFGALTAFSLGIGATFIYTYTPELYPTEIRATGRCSKDSPINAAYETLVRRESPDRDWRSFVLGVQLSSVSIPPSIRYSATSRKLKCAEFAHGEQSSEFYIGYYGDQK